MRKSLDMVLIITLFLSSLSVLGFTTGFLSFIGTARLLAKVIE